MKYALLILALTTSALAAPPPFAPDRKEGEGPWTRLIIRGVTLVDGTGAPPIGPVDIVIEGNRIREVRSVGFPKVPIKPAARPKDAVKEIDGTGIWVLPDSSICTAIPAAKSRERRPSTCFKLWMAHGITSVREPGCGNGVDWCLHERERQRAQRDRRPAALSLHLHQAQSMGRRSDRQSRAGPKVRAMGLEKGGRRDQDPQLRRPRLRSRNPGRPDRRSQQTPPRHDYAPSRRWAWPLEHRRRARMGLRGMEHW